MQRTRDLDARPVGLSRRTFLARAGGVGMTAMLGGLLVACGDAGGGSSSSSGSEAVKVIKPSDVTLALYAVDYLSEDLGYYADEGLEVELVPLLGGPVALQGLLSGAGAANISTPGEMLGAIAKGQGVTALMSHANMTAATLVISRSFADKLGVTAQSTTQQRTDALGSVKGGRFGITTPGSQTDGFTRMALEQAGLDPDKDARIVPLQNAANSLAALAKGRIDGFMALSPVTEEAVVRHGAFPLLAVADGEIREAAALQGQTLMARPSDIEQNPDLFRRIVRANVRALRMLIEEPDRAGEVLRRSRFSEMSEDVWSLMWRNNVPAWTSPYIQPGALAAWVDNGLVADASDTFRFDYDAIFDTRFVDEAVQEIGWTGARA